MSLRRMLHMPGKRNKTQRSLRLRHNASRHLHMESLERRRLLVVGASLFPPLLLLDRASMELWTFPSQQEVELPGAQAICSRVPDTFQRRPTA